MVHSARAVPIDHRTTLFSLVDSGMVGTLIVIYLGGWLPVTLAAYAAGKRLRDPHAPAKHPVMVFGRRCAVAASGRRPDRAELGDGVHRRAGQHHKWQRRLRV